jgi:hypothetical protein
MENGTDQRQVFGLYPFFAKIRGPPGGYIDLCVIVNHLVW